MAISALGEADGGMQAKIKVSTVREKCKGSPRTGDQQTSQKRCQCVQIPAVRTWALGEMGPSWVSVMYFSCGKAAAPSGGC